MDGVRMVDKICSSVPQDVPLGLIVWNGIRGVMLNEAIWLLGVSVCSD
jgi:hypothetical protein